MLENVISVADFISEVQHSMRLANSNDAKAISAAVLAENPRCRSLAINDTAPFGHVEQRIFEELISSKQIVSVALFPGFDVNFNGNILQKAVSNLPCLHNVAILTKTSESEAEAIFSILETSSARFMLHIYIERSTFEIAIPLNRYLKESSTLNHLRLSWGDSTISDNDEPVSFLQDAMATICDGIGKSASLGSLLINAPPTSDDNADAAAELVARACANSTTIKVVATMFGQEEFMNKIRNALLRTQAVQNFGLCFRRSDESQRQLQVLVLFRDAPWKPLLSKNVPLALWPRILAKGNSWKREANSHSRWDVLYFLFKEKNDVLLQNVRRRKIRKRKRYQMA